ncbi:trypsin-like peptidase domain-containing protein [uncultured Ruegeria sp.]|uniref:S1C family serine protease n=1 Tax=uncultured Ruegeria sp. TaxID=259304 RepID=UPI0026204039|nr:trypsin-like peptidase domain-containing protein [uncultured Ruegeria sp.]
MRILLNLVAVISLVGVIFPSIARSQDFEALLQGFDATNLSYEDKRFLQTALAFEGHYHGLLDGAWGKISNRALDDYSREVFETDPEDWHMAFLAWTLFERISQDGWDIQYFEGLGLSFLWPEDAIRREADSDYFLNYRHANSSFSISVGVHSVETAQSLHDFTIQSHQLVSDPYTVRKNNLAVSSATKRDSSTLYTRSDFVNGGWSTVMLSASEQDGHILGAVASSISKGRANPLDISNNGKLDRVIQQVVAALEEADESTGEDPGASSPGTQGSAGTGFIVSRAGHVLTNQHVVDGCAQVFIDDRPATVVSSSEEYDLALLKYDAPKDRGIAVFSASPARLNSDVTAVGYPYAGLLGGLNVTRGSVSSLKGIGGDLSTMQITSPIQSGNSGGPLLASDGEVVGVVVAKLNERVVTDAIGDTPQNVNFAVRGEIAKLFLTQNAINPILSLDDKKLEPEEVADLAASFTTFVECR